MRAIDREDLELFTTHAPHPARNIRGFPIRWVDGWMPESGQARLALGKLAERAELEPGFSPRPPFTNAGRQEVSHNWHGQDDTHGPVKQDPNLHQHPAPGNSFG